MLEIFLFNSKFISTINDEIKENFNNQTKFKTFYVLNFLFENIKKNNRKLLLNFYFDQKENKFKYSKYFFISWEKRIDRRTLYNFYFVISFLNKYNDIQW